MIVHSKFWRVIVLQLLYSAVLVLALFLAFEFRFDLHPAPFLEQFKFGLALSLGLTLPALWLFGQYRSLLSYFGLPDAQKIVFATTLSTLGMYASWYMGFSQLTPPRGVIILNFVFASTGLICVRLLFRILRERFSEKVPRNRKKKRLAIYGAGSVDDC